MFGRRRAGCIPLVDIGDSVALLLQYINSVLQGALKIFFTWTAEYSAGGTRSRCLARTHFGMISKHDSRLSAFTTRPENVEDDGERGRCSAIIIRLLYRWCRIFRKSRTRGLPEQSQVRCGGIENAPVLPERYQSSISCYRLNGSALLPEGQYRFPVSYRHTPAKTCRSIGPQRTAAMTPAALNSGDCNCVRYKPHACLGLSRPWLMN
jgi:hypothetical protein